MTISGVPAGTRSLAITMFDPDAPTRAAGGNGSCTTCRRARDGAPAHRYEFILWAERVRTLGVPANASAALISLMIERYAIAHRMVVVPYSR